MVSSPRATGGQHLIRWVNLPLTNLMSAKVLHVMNFYMIWTFDEITVHTWHYMCFTATLCSFDDYSCQYLYFHRWTFQHCKEDDKSSYHKSPKTYVWRDLMVTWRSLFQFVRLPVWVMPVTRQRLMNRRSAAIRSASEVVLDRRMPTASPAKPSSTMVAAREIALLDCMRSVLTRVVL